MILHTTPFRLPSPIRSLGDAPSSPKELLVVVFYPPKLLLAQECELLPAPSTPSNQSSKDWVSRPDTGVWIHALRCNTTRPVSFPPHGNRCLYQHSQATTYCHIDRTLKGNCWKTYPSSPYVVNDPPWSLLKSLLKVSF